MVFFRTSIIPLRCNQKRYATLINVLLYIFLFRKFNHTKYLIFMFVKHIISTRNIKHANFKRRELVFQTLNNFATVRKYKFWNLFIIEFEILCKNIIYGGARYFLNNIMCTSDSAYYLLFHYLCCKAYKNR